MKIFKTTSEIEKEYNKKFSEVCKEYYNQGYSVAEITRVLSVRNQSGVYNSLYPMNNYKLRKEHPPIYKNLFLMYHDRENLLKNLKREIGMELKDFLYEKYIVEKHNAVEIALMFGCSSSTIGRWLKNYNIVKTKSQIRKDAISQGRVNYAEIARKGRETNMKMQFRGHIEKNFPFQEFVREKLRAKIEEFIIGSNISDIKNKIEIVIGVNEWCVLKDVELDVPIIIINNTNKKFIKYSVEVNGENFHERRLKNDINKKERAISQDWKHYIICSKDNLEYKINMIVNDIKKSVEAIL